MPTPKPNMRFINLAVSAETSGNLEEILSLQDNQWPIIRQLHADGKIDSEVLFIIDKGRTIGYSIYMFKEDKTVSFPALRSYKERNLSVSEYIISTSGEIFEVLFRVPNILYFGNSSDEVASALGIRYNVARTEFSYKLETVVVPPEVKTPLNPETGNPNESGKDINGSSPPNDDDTQVQRKKRRGRKPKAHNEGLNDIGQIASTEIFQMPIALPEGHYDIGYFSRLVGIDEERGYDLVKSWKIGEHNGTVCQETWHIGNPELDRLFPYVTRDFIKEQPIFRSKREDKERVLTEFQIAAYLKIGPDLTDEDLLNAKELLHRKRKVGNPVIVLKQDDHTMYGAYESDVKKYFCS